jgi:hypothetical protein
MATTGVIAAVLGAGAAVYGAATAGKNAPKLPELQPEKRVQDAKGPEGQVINRQNGMGIPAGAATMLTGSTGVNPSSLSVGKNTLLGG